MFPPYHISYRATGVRTTTGQYTFGSQSVNAIQFTPKTQIRMIIKFSRIKNCEQTPFTHDSRHEICVNTVKTSDGMTRRLFSSVEYTLPIN